MLINRVANTDMTWHQEVTNAAPRVSPIVDLTLDDASVLRAIDNLNFIQIKREYMLKINFTFTYTDCLKYCFISLIYSLRLSCF